MKTTRSLAAGALFSVAAVFVAAGVACNDPEEHVYTAELYEPAADCLDPYTALDIIAGGDGGAATCSPVCLVGNNATYVSTVCPPYPVGYDTSGTDPSCAPALADYATDGGGRYCANLPDGGAPTPDATGDTSTPDAATTDASTSDAGDAADAPTE